MSPQNEEFASLNDVGGGTRTFSERQLYDGVDVNKFGNNGEISLGEN